MKPVKAWGTVWKDDNKLDRVNLSRSYARRYKMKDQKIIKVVITEVKEK